MERLLAGNAALVVPAAPGPAPLLDMEPSSLNQFRQRLLALTSIAGLAGLPQASHSRLLIIVNAAYVAILAESVQAALAGAHLPAEGLADLPQASHS